MQMSVKVIDYLNVADPQNKRYWPQGGETYCNIFARDVMRCLRAPLTHWVGKQEQGANEMYDWLNDPVNGWKKRQCKYSYIFSSTGHSNSSLLEKS